MTIDQRVKEMILDGERKRIVKFKAFGDGKLYYRTESGFEFPVDELSGATFYAEEPAHLFMRWIRKQLELEATYPEKARQPIPA